MRFKTNLLVYAATQSVLKGTAKPLVEVSAQSRHILPVSRFQLKRIELLITRIYAVRGVALRNGVLLRSITSPFSSLNLQSC